MNHLKSLIVTCGGLGLLKRAPGTWGSIPPAIALLMLLLLGVDPMIYLFAAVGITLLASLLCLVFTPWAEQRWKKPDPRMMVQDEIAGMALTLLAPPVIAFKRPETAILFVIIGFILFRILDITKPGLIEVSQRLKAGWGVLLDDLLAGGVALGALTVGWRLFA